jgi:hypothetical protein
MKNLTLIAITLCAACGSKKSPPPDPGSGTASTPTAGTGSAPAAGTGSAPAGSGTTPAGSGSDMAAGSGSDHTHATVATGSGSGSGQLIDDPGINFDNLTPEWEHGHGKLDTFVPVNESKFPVDNAAFVFEYSLDPPTMPTDPKEYAALLEKSGVMEKIVKSEPQKNGHYYESAHAFRYVIVAGDKRIHCGGPLYNDPAHKDYDAIPKERAKVIADAKKICATAKLPAAKK